MNAKRFFGFLFVSILVIFLTILAFSLVTREVDISDRNDVDISDLASEPSEFSYVFRGKIVGENNHMSYRITINKDQRSIEVLRGYNGEVIRKASFDNTEKAYLEFLSAMERAGLGIDTDDVNLKGICANGYLHTYEMYEESELKTSQFLTSCLQGSLEDFNPNSIIRNQIPDYRQYIDDINFNTSGDPIK